MSARWKVSRGGALRGVVHVPGDKSISHRALLFGALARGRSRIRGLLDSEDVRASRHAVGSFGVEVKDGAGGAEVVIHGTGALSEPDQVIDCGNSGTTMRLLAGVAAGESFHTVLTGDPSLRRRPMGRVAVPLRAMGAQVDGRRQGDLAPLAIRGGALSPIPHTLPVASAQLKTALLLATRRQGAEVWEPGASRDHTERLLAMMGASLSREDTRVTLAPIEVLEPLDLHVPGDFSSAAFWLVGASIVAGSEIRLPGVGLNPTRAGALEVLRAMGADIEVVEDGGETGEPWADLVVRSAALRGTVIEGPLALRALDELPVLAVAAAFAEGETVIRDAGELRVKESDRVARCVEGLRAIGVEVEERPDGMVIQGGEPSGGGMVSGHGDHRLVMAFAIAGAACPRGVSLEGADEVRTSYPAFPATLARVGAAMERA